MRVQIFRSGSHVAANGERLTFTDADLHASAHAYDPQVHEAPVVVGHPKTDAPAYGWIGALAFDDGAMHADATQVDPAFAELVTKGRFKKVSASFYRPDAAGNPKPGVYYLRHVGFLGATPPAIKGLKPVEFAADTTGIVEFAWTERENASLWRGLRDWLIDKFSLEEADRVVPPWAVATLEADAAAKDAPSYTETNPDMDPKELQRREAAIAEREQQVQKREAEFAERDAQQAAEQAKARTTVAAQYVDALVKAGKILPRHQSRLAALFVSLPSTQVEFAEGDEKKTAEPGVVLREIFDALPAQIDYSERSGTDRLPPGNLSPRELAKRAQQLVDKAAAEGRTLSYTEAMDEVYEQEGMPNNV